MEVTIDTIIEELKNNPKVQNYLAAYESSSGQRFLNHYASTKLLLLNYGDLYRDLMEKDSVHYREWAEKYYWQIAQKKLFNQQCLWRAEAIDLPIEATYEFFYWGQNIKACPFIEPTAEDEIATLIEFLEGAPYDHGDNDISDWQDYDSFKESGAMMEVSDDYPNWYAWYDVHIGPPHIMTLPNVRGEFQERCLAALRKATTIEVSLPGSYKAKPFINFNKIEDFVKAVEPYKILETYHNYVHWSNKNNKLEEVNDVLEILFEEPGEVIIPQGRFPDAIFQAAYLLRIRKIKRLLPLIHQEHMERLQMGISYELLEDEFVNTCRANIKEGKRILEGEQ